MSETELKEFFRRLPDFVDDTTADYIFGEEDIPIIFRETLAGDKQFGTLTPSNGMVR